MHQHLVVVLRLVVVQHLVEPQHLEELHHLEVHPHLARHHRQGQHLDPAHLVVHLLDQVAVDLDRLLLLLHSDSSLLLRLVV